MHHLGVIFDDGLGIAANQTTAQRYYRAAAEGGSVAAMLTLGERTSADTA